MTAADMLDKAVELDPSFTLAYAWLAVVDLSLYSYLNFDPTLERLEKGKSALAKATQLDPDFPEVHFAQAKYYTDIENDSKRALIEYLKALEGRPNDSWINQYTGISYKILGEWDKAERYLLKAYELDPHGLHMAHEVADFYSCMHDWQKAEYYSDKAIISFPEEPFYYYFKALIALMGFGDTEKAARIIDEGAQSVDKHRMFRYRFLIDILTRRFQDILDSVEPFPDFDYYYYHKGFAFWFMGKEDQANTYLDSARIVFENLVRTASYNITNYSRLGLVYAGLGMKEKAIQFAKKSVELEPISKNAYRAPSRHYRLAEVYSIVGEYDKALDEIELLLSIPYYFTTWDLKLNPFWDPLRDNPRFQELIEKYEGTEG